VVVWTEGRAAVERCRPGVARGGDRRDRLVPAGKSTHRRAARTALPGLARPAVSRVQQRTHRM